MLGQANQTMTSEGSWPRQPRQPCHASQVNLARQEPNNLSPNTSLKKGPRVCKALLSSSQNIRSVRPCLEYFFVCTMLRPYLVQHPPPFPTCSPSPNPLTQSLATSADALHSSLQQASWSWWRGRRILPRSQATAATPPASISIPRICVKGSRTMVALPCLQPLASLLLSS